MANWALCNKQHFHPNQTLLLIQIWDSQRRKSRSFPPQLLEPLKTPKALLGCLCLTQFILYFQHKALLANSTFCVMLLPHSEGLSVLPVHQLHSTSVPSHSTASLALPVATRGSQSLAALGHWLPMHCSATSPTANTHSGLSSLQSWPQSYNIHQIKPEPFTPLCPSHSNLAFHGTSTDPVNVTPVATRGR